MGMFAMRKPRGFNHSYIYVLFFLFHCFPEFPDFFSEVRYIGAENARSSRHKNAGSTGTQRRAVLLRNVSVHF